MENPTQDVLCCHYKFGFGPLFSIFRGGFSKSSLMSPPLTLPRSSGYPCGITINNQSSRLSAFSSLQPQTMDGRAADHIKGGSPSSSLCRLPPTMCLYSAIRDPACRATCTSTSTTYCYLFFALPAPAASCLQTALRPPTVASFLIPPRADPLLSSKSVASFFKSTQLSAVAASHPVSGATPPASVLPPAAPCYRRLATANRRLRTLTKAHELG